MYDIVTLQTFAKIFAMDDVLSQGHRTCVTFCGAAAEESHNVRMRFEDLHDP